MLDEISWFGHETIEQEIKTKTKTNDSILVVVEWAHQVGGGVEDPMY